MARKKSNIRGIDIASLEISRMTADMPLQELAGEGWLFPITVISPMGYALTDVDRVTLMGLRMMAVQGEMLIETTLASERVGYRSFQFVDTGGYNLTMEES